MSVWKSHSTVGTLISIGRRIRLAVTWEDDWRKISESANEIKIRRKKNRTHRRHHQRSERVSTEPAVRRSTIWALKTWQSKSGWNLIGDRRENVVKDLAEKNECENRREEWSLKELWDGRCEREMQKLLITASTRCLLLFTVLFIVDNEWSAREVIYEWTERLYDHEEIHNHPVCGDPLMLTKLLWQSQNCKISNPSPERKFECFTL